MINKIDTIVTRAILDKTFPGCVIGIVKHGEKPVILPYGTMTGEPDSPAIESDSVFDIASVTKSIPTASLALKAVELDKILLDEPVISHMPEFNTGFCDQVTVRHLLTHTVAFNLQLSAYKNCPPRDILSAIMHAELLDVPGRSFYYCNATSIVLGILVERVFKKPLDLLAEQYFFKPLGMQATSFHPDPADKRIVPTEIDSWRGKAIKALVHDESAWVLQRIMIPGSAGLFSNAPDLCIFLAMLIHEGTLNEHTCFNPETIELLSTNQIAHLSEQTGLGWELNQRRYMGEVCSKRTIGKTGFTGCVVVADLEKKIGIVILSNYTWPLRKNDKDRINIFRSAIITSILES